MPDFKNARRAANSDASEPQVQVSKRAWRTATWSLAVLVVVCVCGLLAQTSVAPGSDSGQADPLATLALVLAVLAFVIQIITYAIQTNAASAALRRGDEVSAETLRLLDRVSASAELMKQTQTDQLNRFIDKALDPVDSSSAAPQGSGASNGDESELGAEPDGGRDGHGRHKTPAELLREAVNAPRPPSPEDARIIEALQTYPSRELGELGVARVRALPTMAVVALGKLGENEVTARLDNRPVGISFVRESPVPGALEAEGLAEIRSTTETGLSVIGLTDTGRMAARVLTTKAEPPPAWWNEVIRPLWSRANDG